MMDTNLASKVALVTGGAHRVGRGIVLALAKAGCNIVLHYNGSKDEAQKTADEARRCGIQVVTHQANLENPNNAQALLQKGIDEWGHVDILVNNAAIFPQDTLDTVSSEEWEHTLRINLLSPLFLTQTFAQALPKQQKGAIVNITDSNIDRVKCFSYSMSKSSLNHLTRLAAATFAPRIRVNAIALGAMLPPPEGDETYINQLAAQLPLQRAGGIEPVQQALMYLLNNEFVTGEIIRLDGGNHLQF
ncbi:MAG: SDR family oxidoreductase [Chloroflexota bacterium]